jgi:hypothetical protein
MKQFVFLALAMVAAAIPTYAQFVTRDTVSPASGCHSLYTYDDGVNIRILVLRGSGTKDKADLERTMARDISRFKDTGRIRTSDAIPPNDQHLSEFVVTIIWNEIKTEGETSGYAAAMFTMEPCATFSNSKGFAVNMLSVDDNMFVEPTKEGLLDILEKTIYDSLIRVVRNRRAAIK